MSDKASPVRRPIGRPIRWWPAAVVLILFGGFLARTWWLLDQTRQYSVMQTIAAVLLALVLLLLWLLLASRAPWKWRLTALGLAILAGFGASQMMTIRGVSGDLVPILGLKGRSERDSAALAPVASEDRAVRASGRFEGSVRGDYPQFLGPSRNASVTGVELARDWDAAPPREIWRRAVGAGWSGFAVAGDWAITQEQDGDEEQVVAYGLETGAERWRHADPTRYETTIGGMGPRSTPTIADGAVYTLGATGILNALELATGKRLWSHDILKENGARNREWGKSCSPLVVDGLVVVSAGGVSNQSLVAYDRATGELAWAAGTDTSSYSSPVLAELAGRRQILMRNQGSMTAHDPATGKILWSENWSAEQPNVAVPLLLGGNRVLFSSGYGIGSKLFEIAESNGTLEPRLLWESPRLKAKFTNLVAHRGFVYGLDDGVLVCLDPSTGERCWKKGRYGHGQMILAQDLLLLTTEKGEVVLIEPNPDELRELGRIAPFEGKTWNPAALAGSLLLLRTDKEAVLYELPVQG
ncbi:MAG: PQQ-binding-like beta-propeller repeat protein [bacterium]|nr:PQQ-binding-like beta-propeller repeat protein [bacterium]